jgi:hypothetical protein
MRSQTLKALAATDGSLIAGRYENQKLMDHRHHIAGTVDGGAPYLTDDHATGGNLGYAFNGSSSDATLYLTSKPKDDLEAPIGDPDNIVNNLGLYPLICI